MTHFDAIANKAVDENDIKRNLDESNSALMGNINKSDNKNDNTNNSTNIQNGSKCAWCDRPRARNDLCNRCRQKVELRARTLNEQKMLGDCQVFKKIILFFKDNINLNHVSNIEQFCQTFLDIFPFLVCNYKINTQNIKPTIINIIL